MHQEPPVPPTGPSGPSRPLPKREACPDCGKRLGRKWGSDRVTLIRFCANEDCKSFGIPSVRHVKTKVVVEDDGTVHVHHREAYSQRGTRPDFVQPA